MKRKLTVSQNICLVNVVLILVIVLLTGGISLYFTLSNKQRDLDATIQDIAEMMTQYGCGAGGSAKREAV